MQLANGDVIDGADERGSSFVRFINHSVRRANCEAHDAWEEDEQGIPRFSPKRLVIDYF